MKKATSEGKMVFFRYTKLVIKERTSHHHTTPTCTIGRTTQGDGNYGAVPTIYTTTIAGTAVSYLTSSGEQGTSGIRMTSGATPAGTSGDADNFCEGAVGGSETTDTQLEDDASPSPPQVRSKRDKGRKKE